MQRLLGFILVAALAACGSEWEDDSYDSGDYDYDGSSGHAASVCLYQYKSSGYGTFSWVCTANPASLADCMDTYKSRSSCYEGLCTSYTYQSHRMFEGTCDEALASVSSGSGGSSGSSGSGGHSGSGGWSGSGGFSGFGGTSGSGGSSGAGGASACPAVSWTTRNVCTDCIDTNCCAAADACESDTACLACWKGTGTDCDSNWRYQSMQLCKAEECSASCLTTVDSCPGTTFLSYNNCTACLQSRCCDAMTACFDETSSTACWNGDSNSCGSNMPYLAAVICKEEECGGACAGGVDLCEGIAFTNHTSCTACLERGCCDSLDACFADESCLDCWNGDASGALCTNSSKYQDALSCRASACSAYCSHA